MIRNINIICYIINKILKKMSDNDNDNEFQATDSGASGTFPLSANDIKVGSHILLKTFPCRAVNVDHVKTGKHGHAKVVTTGIDIFTTKKYEDSFPASHSVQSFVQKKEQYQVVNLDETQLTLLSDDNNTREDLNLPEDGQLAENIKNLFESGESITVTVLSAIGREQIVDCKKE
jgi:translation initiation factor 5A